MCFHVFAMVSSPKHGTYLPTLHFCRPPYKPVENIMFDNASNSLISPIPLENTRYLQCFSSIFSINFQCQPVANSNIYIYIRNPSKTLFLTVFFRNGCPVKQTVIYTFFAINRQSKTLVIAVFSMLWHPKTLQNLAMYNVFFHFWPFFHCRKATKMTQNSISIPSCAQTPKNPRKMSETPPNSGLGAKPFLAAPVPQLKLI